MSGLEKANRGTANPKSGSDEAATDEEPLEESDSLGPVGTDPTFISGATGTVEPEPAPMAPAMSVELETRIYTLVVGGSAGAQAEFSWTTSGSDDALVHIEMKTSVTNPDWTPILADLPPSDVGERYGLPLVRQTMWFRAVATHPDFPNDPATSNIVRFD